MEGSAKRGQRPVRCRFEPHRLDEELLALAYERLWPQLRRVVPESRNAVGLVAPMPIAEMAEVARRA